MFAENLHKIEEKIKNSCLKAGRKRSEIRLIAVSKTQPVSVINDAVKAGLFDMGEYKA